MAEQADVIYAIILANIGQAVLLLFVGLVLLPLLAAIVRVTRSILGPSVLVMASFVVPEIFISAVICAFHAAKSHSFRTPRLSFKRSPGRLAAKAGQNRRGIVPFARHKKIALRKGTPFLAIMRSSHLML